MKEVPMFEEIAETFKAIMKEGLEDMKDEAKHQLGQGAHELAAALFRGSDGFVMYPRQEQQKEEEQQKPPPELQQDMGMER
jgi:hypothetical protein